MKNQNVILERIGGLKNRNTSLEDQYKKEISTDKKLEIITEILNNEEVMSVLEWVLED